MENWISHNRDYDFTYAGLRQVIDKYLVQDRSTNVVYETPQFMYMMIAATLFAKYPKTGECHMLKNIMTLYHNLKLIFQRLLWLVSVPLLSSMLVVSLLTLTILYLVSLVVTWAIGTLCCPKGWDRN